MKRYVKASKGQTEKLHDLVAYLSQEGVDEHELLMYFFDCLPSSQCYNMLVQLAENCDIDLEDFYNEGYIRSEEIIEDDGWDIDPFHGKRYHVAYNYDSTCTDNPYTAIKLWFKNSEMYPSDCAITARTKQDGIDLLNVAAEIVPEMYARYRSPYKLEYMEDCIQRMLSSNLPYFHESEYGDQVDPFSYG